MHNILLYPFKNINLILLQKLFDPFVNISVLNSLNESIMCKPLLYRFLLREYTRKELFRNTFKYYL